MKTEANTNREDILTIAEFRKRMGPTAPSHNAIRKAINRNKLKKLPDLNHDGHVQVLGGEFLDYMAAGGFKQVSLPGKLTSELEASPELDEVASLPTATLDESSVATVAETHPDSDSIEEVSAEMKAGQGTASELEEVEKLVIGLPNFTDKDTIEALSLYSNRAKMCFSESLVVGARALIFAWACGTILIKVKADRDHGKFGPWLKEHLEPLGLSSRSYQRYMKLAHAWPHLGDLVESQSGLKKAYVACGIIQESESTPIDVEESNGEDTAQASEKRQPTKSILAFVINLKKRLSHGASAGEILTPEDLDQLGGAIDELTRFYKQQQHSSTADSIL